MKRTLVLASSVAIFATVLAPPVWARGFGGGGGGRGGYGGGGRGGYGGGHPGGSGGYHGGEGGYHGGESGYHGGEQGGYHGNYGGYHGGEQGHGNYADGFHGGEEGYHGGYGAYGQHPGTNVAGSQMAGGAAGKGVDSQLFGSQGAGKNLSNVNGSNLSSLQGAGKNLSKVNGSNLSNLQGTGKNLSNVNPNNFNGSNLNGSNLNGSHLQQWQQQQPYNNWYQGHGNWGNGQWANAAGNLAGTGAGWGAAAAGWGAAGLGAAAATLPGWGLGSAYYNSGYGSYYNPYYDSGDDGSSGYNYSQPVQLIQYNAPSQSQQGDGNGGNGSNNGSNNNGPTASDEALQHGEAARTAFRNQDYSKALSEANLALAKMPGDPGLHEFRALVLFALGQYKPAAAAIHSILAVGPGWNWTTMIGLYGDDSATYTKQLRALESAVTSNPDSSSDHFLLAYQYLTCNQTDAAAAQLQKVVELTPKDQLAPQLLATIKKPADASTPAATTPAASTEKPLAASALVGDWTSKRDDGSAIELKFTNDSKFTWIYTANGKTQKFGGTAADVNGLLALQREDGNALMAHVTSTDGGSFRLRLVGGPANDPGLVFTH
jgi:hypothetical protein